KLGAVAIAVLAGEHRRRQRGPGIEEERLCATAAFRGGEVDFLVTWREGHDPVVDAGITLRQGVGVAAVHLTIVDGLLIRENAVFAAGIVVERIGDGPIRAIDTI